MKKILVCTIGCFVALGIAAAADDQNASLTARRKCVKDTCAAAACPADTDHQTGACRCNSSCGCTGNIICYDAAGVVLANNDCSGTCKWVTLAPGDPEEPDGAAVACNPDATDDKTDPNAEKKPEAPKAEKKPADPPAQPEPTKQPQH